MNAWLSIIGKIIVDMILQLAEKLRPRHHEGQSDGTTEKALKDKARKDGWDV